MKSGESTLATLHSLLATPQPLPYAKLAACAYAHSGHAFAMPANLTAQYHKAEAEYRRAVTAEEQLQWLQEMLREMPKHKGTDKLQSDLKQKISKLKKEATAPGKSGRHGPGFRILRQGSGTVVILGGVNAGKSQILATFTRAKPEIAPYPFTTREPLPGMMPWQDVMVQLIDTPPISMDFLESYMQGLIRSADLVLLLVDLGNDDGIEQCQEVLDKLNTTKTRLAKDTYLDENDVGLSYTRTFSVPNKSDLDGAEERLRWLHELCPLDFPEFVVSAAQGTNLEPLRDAIYESLDVIRVYTKLPSQKRADYDRPFTVRRGGTLLDVAEQIHKNYVQDLKFARVWGSQVHDGTVVKADYIVQDKDVVELHT